MDLRQLKTFQMVASTLSFTQAAAILNYAQSSVTAQIQALEEELDVPLFDRIGRRVQLTSPGREFLRYTERLLSLAEEAQAVVSGNGQPDGVLSIGAPETIFTYRIPPFLRRFRDEYPNVRLHFQPMLDVDSLKSVKDGSIDVAFLLQEPLQSDSLAVERLIQEPLELIAPEDHVLAGQSTVRPADLAGETILLTENGCGYRHLFEQELSRSGVYSVVKLEFSSVEAIKQCVIAGLGIAFLPRVAVQEQIDQGRLAALGWQMPFEVYTQMVWHRARWIPPALREFLIICRQMELIPQNSHFVR
jgi:DNA-binding transcriptional LysR family regulator